MRQNVIDRIGHPSAVKERIQDRMIEMRAHFLVNVNQHFHGRADRFGFRSDEGVLTVWGSVPSYYLKQVMQSVLQDVPGIRVIDNRVTVVSSDGIGSVSAG
jgi:hypothetical protein